MKKTIYACVLSAAASAAFTGNSNDNEGQNDAPSVGFFDSEDTVNRLKTEVPNSVLSEPQDFTIDTDVSNDLDVWTRDDVQQAIQQGNLTEA